MINFKKCIKCDQMLTTENCRVKTTGIGVWLHHPDCVGDSMITRQTLSRWLANASEMREPLTDAERVYFTQLLKDVDNGVP